MPTGNEENIYTFTGHLVEDEERAKKEIHIHIENLENLDLHIQM